MKVGFLYCVAVIGLLLVNSASGTVFFVNPQATGTTNGLSWSNAYRCLPESLRDAHAGDQIWVAAGVYFGNITVPAGVSLYGGFSGAETERTQRDWMSRRTVIEPFDPDWLLFVGRAESLVTLSAGSRLDGFIVENGRAPYAAGVYVGAPDAVAANNTIVSNRVTGILGGAGVFVDTPLRFPLSGADEFFHRYADAFLRLQYPFGATNIPVYPTNQYTPAVHRLLQVAANLYAATLPDPFPPVFRPKFAPDPNLTGGVIISGYYLDNDPATVDAWLETNPYRIPAILGARKGLPNFNELTTQNGVMAARRLQFVRSRTNAPPFQTNQMYVIGISNSVGVEFWNSYTQTFAPELQLDCRFTGSYELISGGITLATGDESLTVHSNIPPNSWKGYLGFENELSRLSFKVPLLTNTIFVSNSVQRFSPTPRLEPLTGTFESGGFPIPEWQLAVSNSFVCVLSSGSRIVDLVLLPNLTNRVNVSSVIFNAPAEMGASGALNWWSTNRSGGDGTPTTGVLNQIATSLDNPPLDTFYWREYGLGNQFMTGQDRDRAIDSFRRFMFPSAYTNSAKTNLIEEAPFSPTRKLVFVRSWQANDPLVHHLPGHLISSSNNSAILLVRPQTGELTTNLNLGLLNTRYHPWRGGGVRRGPDDFNPTLKDQGVANSDDWRFPSSDRITVRWLDAIPRGTPWQSLYFDGIAADMAAWNRAFYDPDGLAHPTNDWELIRLIRPDLVADSPATSSVINNTIVGNAASRGAALFVASGAAATSINNIFAFNESGVYAEPNASVELANNCVHGNSVAYEGVSGGPSDLNANPRFRDVMKGDFSLLADSDLIDAGNDAALSTSERSGPTQVYGSHIDIGAHEFGPAGTPVITGNGVISEDGVFQIMARGFAGQQYVIEASPDLLSWTALSTNVAQLGQFVFRDAQSTNLPQRFYRVKLHSP